MKRLEMAWGEWRVNVEAGRFEKPEKPLVANLYETGFTGWDAAAALSSPGYAAPNILERAVMATREVCDGKAAFERDTITFSQPETDHSLLAWLLYGHATENGLRLLDFGGALGSSYYQHRRFLDPLPGFSWGVVEQPHFVQAGQKEFETKALRFFADTEDCVRVQSPNFLLMSGVLQYLPDPYSTLGHLLSLNIPLVLIHNTYAKRHGVDEIAVQHVQPVIYSASYPVWFLDAERMEALFREYHYEIFDNFDPRPGSYFGPVGRETPYQSWFLAHKG